MATGRDRVYLALEDEAESRRVRAAWAAILEPVVDAGMA
jgi:hypothetical protein